MASEDGPTKECLSISNSDGFGRGVLGIAKASYVTANYPEHNILELGFSDNRFDFCISDQVFEHIEGSPLTAFAETARVLKPGGYACHTTCFINQIHNAPGDFWRFTPKSLELMAKMAGLKTVLVSGWGNREVGGLLENLEARFWQIPDDPENPVYQLATRNEPDWPITVWIVAQKPI